MLVREESPCLKAGECQTHQEEWRGSLTIGQHSYLWSSADVGDAHLLSTEPCNSLEDAIAALKAEMIRLFKAFSAD